MNAGGSERKARTYLPTGVVDVLRIICVLCSLLHCALFSAPTAYYLLALTCNCIDLQYTTRTPAPPTPPMDFFPLFENVSGLCRGDGSLLRLARRDGTTADATLCCAGMSRNFILPS